MIRHDPGQSRFVPDSTTSGRPQRRAHSLSACSFGRVGACPWSAASAALSPRVPRSRAGPSGVAWARLAGQPPRSPVPDRDAVAVEDRRAVRIGPARRRASASVMGVEMGSIRPTRLFAIRGPGRRSLQELVVESLRVCPWSAASAATSPRLPRSRAGCDLLAQTRAAAHRRRCPPWARSEAVRGCAILNRVIALGRPAPYCIGR